MPDAEARSADTPTRPTVPDKPKGLFAVKEALTSIVIAFALAFVFRGFVLEAFVIPTGSMAPTLLGQHHRLTGPRSGYTWTIGPWQGGEQVRVPDPMTREPVTAPARDVPRLSGDRIFVLKYLPPVYPPKRWDVSVFKYPPDPRQNYIKRLVGLPGEQVALLDGDVFVRTPSDATRRTGAEPPTAPDTWNQQGWRIARKPERVQRAVWQPVFDSRFAPLAPVIDGRRWFVRPWLLESDGGARDPGPGGGWTVEDESVYRYEGEGPARLRWDSTRRPITDETAYNWTGANNNPDFFPVSDIATLIEVQPDDEGLVAEAALWTRRHAFRARIGEGRALIEMRPQDESEWRALAEGDLPAGALRPGAITPIEFWHVDQRLTLWVSGEKVAEGDYDWSPVGRSLHTLGLDLTDERTLDAIDYRGALAAGRVQPSLENNPFVDLRRYPVAELAWAFDGGSFSVMRTVVERDMFFRPGFYQLDNDTGRTHTRAGQPTLASHPVQTPAFGADQFLLLGDNSGASADGRVWESPSPWVVDQVDSTMGVVHRDLLIGRAFIVYFPAPHAGRFLPIPDAGRMRWIW